LDSTGGAVLGQEFRPWKTCADHQQRIATLHEVPAWLGAKQSNRAGDEGQAVWQHILAQQRLRDAGAEQGGHLGQLRCRAAGACADQDRYLLAGIKDFRCPGEVSVFWHDLRFAVPDAGPGETVCHSRVLERFALDVLWKNDD